MIFHHGITSRVNSAERSAAIKLILAISHELLDNTAKYVTTCKTILLYVNGE